MKLRKLFKLRIYNTLSRKKESFIPIKKGTVSIYSCGPTLHKAHTHIGNLWAYTFADFVKRYFLYYGFDVKDVIKITDVDDHIIKEHQEAGIPLKQYTKPFYKEFLNQIRLLNIITPTFIPKLTDNVECMTEAVRLLRQKGFTYKSGGSTYFRINNSPDYGLLADLKKQTNLKKNAQKRMESFIEDEKENVNDFCLWKAWSPDEGKVYWQTELGKGRPGWHLECSVMSRKYLGDTFDIHIGGISHIFPHHTNEVAISEAITGEKSVNYWVHLDYLVFESEAMSPRKGTLFTLEDIIKKGYQPMELRHLFLKTHYRQKHNLTWQSMLESRREIHKIVSCLLLLESVTRQNNNNLNLPELLQYYQDKFLEGLGNDFNTSIALTVLFDLINKIHKNKDLLSKDQAKEIIGFIYDLDKILGFIKTSHDFYRTKVRELIKEHGMESLLKRRVKAKKENDYDEADKIRLALSEIGLKVVDSNYSSFYVDLLE